MKVFIQILPFIFFGISSFCIYSANTKNNQAVRFSSFVAGSAFMMGLLLIL